MTQDNYLPWHNGTLQADQHALLEEQAAKGAHPESTWPVASSMSAGASGAGALEDQVAALMSLLQPMSLQSENAAALPAWSGVSLEGLSLEGLTLGDSGPLSVLPQGLPVESVPMGAGPLPLMPQQLQEQQLPLASSCTPTGCGKVTGIAHTAQLNGKAGEKSTPTATMHSAAAPAVLGGRPVFGNAANRGH